MMRGGGEYLLIRKTGSESMATLTLTIEQGISHP
jgi:hypothetical protein